MTQQQLGILLEHSNKSYISELVNSINPFTLKDIVIISRLFKIPLNDLVPTTLSQKDSLRLKEAIHSLDIPKLKLKEQDLELMN